MSSSNLYGPIVSPRDVERGVVASLERWIGDYLGEMERHEGYEPGQIVRPLDIITSTEFRKWGQDATPIILVLNAGYGDKPVRRAEGNHDCSWLVAIMPIVSDTDEMSTRDLMLTYVTACKLAVMQHKMLKSDLYPDGLSTFVMLRDEAYDADVPVLASQSLAAGRLVIEVGVQNAFTESGGTREPLSDPAQDPGPYPPVAVDGVRVDVTPINPTEALV